MVCLEDLWKQKLLALNWPRQCIDKYNKFLAPSSLSQYNAYIKKFHTFCARNEFYEYQSLAAIVAFMNEEAEKSERPESMLKSVLSALKHWFRAKDVNINFDLLENFSKALIRVDTVRPKGRTKILPIQLFVSLFKKWGENDNLSLKQLRQKAITLLAFAAMCRPSDIAPKIGFFRHQLKFNDDGSLTINFFGTKTDSSRTGHEILIKKSSDHIICPVKTLQAYLCRTEQFVKEQNAPVFLTLNMPYAALSAAGVADTLNKSIEEAGLKNSGYSARSFRPTGATAYVTSGVENHITRTIGRWKSEECFNSNYVYPLSSVSATDKLFSAKLPTKKPEKNLNDQLLIN